MSSVDGNGVDGSLLIAAIVPAYNEVGRVGSVVRSLVDSGRFSEVVVVNDGSTDGTSREAEAAGANVVVLPENRGKAEAMLRGVEAVSSPLVAFFDADLTGLIPEHIDRIVGPVERDEVDMMVGLCGRRPTLNWLARRLPLLSGQRALRRHVFEAVPPKLMSGYGAELALDRYCRAHGLRIGAVVLDQLDFVRKMEKTGFLRGLLQYVRMFWQLIVWFVRVRLDEPRKAPIIKTRLYE